jgi:hypothetical protein
MKLALRLAVSTALVMMTIALVPRTTFAACSAGGMVSNVNDCVAQRNGPTECVLEWSVSPVPPIDLGTGLPTARITCLDNDPACDADNTPGQCTFLVGACVNVADSRFTCTPTDASTFLVRKPNVGDAARPHKNRFARANRRNIELGLDDLLPVASPNVCADERAFVVPLKNGNRRASFHIQAQVTSTGSVTDKDSLKFTCLPNPVVIGTQAIASARRITLPSELIGGPLAMGRVGDWIIENDRVRFIIRDVGRDFSFMLTYGGHIMDADFQRSSGPGRDSFLGLTPLINISSTDNPTSITVLNNGGGGGPAILETTGPDDLLDPIDPAVAIKGFNTALSIPPLAIDNNIEVMVRNEYTLAPGDDFVEIETIINNNGGSALDLYTGDFTSGGGQLELVAPGLGFGEAAIRIGGSAALGQQTFDFLGWLGFGLSQGVSYGLIPQNYDLTSAFIQSGVAVTIYAQNLVGLLLAPDDGKPPGALTVTAGGNNSFRRWFALSDNGMGGILDARHKLVARGDITATVNTGFVVGTVSVGGVPVDGARVTIVQKPGVRGASFGLVDAFETKDGGFFQGTLPQGDYVALAKVPGYPYEAKVTGYKGGGAAPLQRPIEIGGLTTVVDFAFPATGFVRVDVTNGVTTLPLSAKVSVVGLQATPETVISEDATLATVTGSLFGYDAREKVTIYGLPQAQFAGPSGSTPVFAVPPGDYQFVVSHGPEYSVSKTTLTVVAGLASTPQVIAAAVVPVVDTTGFVSADHHVHMINSQDSVVSKDERIVTMLAEGVDYFVASDHDFATDLTAEVAALGASLLVKTAVSDEITYFDSGHFGAYPLDLVPGSVTGGAIDWGRAGVEPGDGYPSDGSYDLSVNEMALAAKASPHNATVVQANHFNSGTLGYLRMSGINTKVAPPQSSTPPANLRQNPSLTNLYSDELTALEGWIESSRSQNALAIGENLGDFFNMLNLFDGAHPLQRKGWVCDSDTHTTAIVQAGGPRNMLASATDDPASLVPGDLAYSVNAGRNVCTNGPFVKVKLTGDGGEIASHALADDLLVPATLGSVTVGVDIQSPTWAEFDQVLIYVNNVPSCVKRCIGGSNAGAVCTVASQCPSSSTAGACGVNFVGGTKEECTPNAFFALIPPLSIVTEPMNGSQRLHGTASQVLSISQDSWVVVVVRGQDGVSRPLFPMNPGSILAKACTADPCKSCRSNGECSPYWGTCTVLNQTLAQLTDNGNLGECGVLSLAIANPLFIDRDGDGLYKGVALP